MKFPNDSRKLLRTIAQVVDISYVSFPKKTVGKAIPVLGQRPSRFQKSSTKNQVIRALGNHVADNPEILAWLLSETPVELSTTWDLL